MSKSYFEARTNENFSSSKWPSKIKIWSVDSCQFTIQNSCQSRGGQKYIHWSKSPTEESTLAGLNFHNSQTECVPRDRPDERWGQFDAARFHIGGCSADRVGASGCGSTAQREFGLSDVLTLMAIGRILLVVLVLRNDKSPLAVKLKGFLNFTWHRPTFPHATMQYHRRWRA